VITGGGTGHAPFAECDYIQLCFLNMSTG